MDFGRILIFVPLATYLFYSFNKTKLDVYLILGVLSWYGLIYPGKHNLYQFIQDPLKIIVNIITMLLIFRIFIPVLIPYFKKIVEEYKEYKKPIKE